MADADAALAAGSCRRPPAAPVRHGTGRWFARLSDMLGGWGGLGGLRRRHRQQASGWAFPGVGGLSAGVAGLPAAIAGGASLDVMPGYIVLRCCRGCGELGVDRNDLGNQISQGWGAARAGCAWHWYCRWRWTLVLLVGLIGGSVLAYRKWGMRRPAGDIVIGAMTDALSRDDRRALRRAFLAERVRFEDRRNQMLEDDTEIWSRRSARNPGRGKVDRDLCPPAGPSRRSTLKQGQSLLLDRFR